MIDQPARVELPMPSPFRVGPPVHGDDFFGRTLLLEKIRRLLERGSAINVVSLRRIGKTSMRHQIAHLCRHDAQWNRFRPISIDAEMFSSIPSLMTGVIRHIANELNFDLRAADEFDAWLQLRDRLQSATGETILLLDESQILGRSVGQASLRTLRTLQQEQVLGLVLFTAYRTIADIVQLEDDNSTDASSLYNIFFALRLPAFAIAEAETLLTTLFIRGGKSLDGDLARLIAEYVGGYPQLVQEVGDVAFEYCEESGRDEIDATHFGEVRHRWKARAEPWWEDMLMHALEAMAHPKHLESNSTGSIEALADYGIVLRDASGQWQLSPFVGDLTTRGPYFPLGRKIREVLDSTAKTAATSNSKGVGMTSTMVDVFVAYSHKDEELRDELAAHLKLLERTKVIRSWHDRRIGAGDAWRKAIDDNLEKAHIILLLVSSDFLASDFIYEVEMRHALARYRSGEVVVIPIILRDCKWDRAPFAPLQALPKDAKPITSWTNRDEAWTNVVTGIEAAAMQIAGP